MENQATKIPFSEQSNPKRSVTSMQGYCAKFDLPKYEYFKLVEDYLQRPGSDDFVYLTLQEPDSPVYDPYALKEVPYGEINKYDFFTLSSRGIAHYETSNSQFTDLERWKQEARSFYKLKNIKLFKDFILWKIFKIWKKSIRKNKIQTAKSRLEDQLFVLDPIFQDSLLQTNGLCQEISSIRLHQLEATETYHFFSLNDEVEDSCAINQEKLNELCEDIKESVLEASILNFDRLERKLDEFRTVKLNDSLQQSLITKSSQLRSKTNSMKSLNSMIKRTSAGTSKTDDKEFAFTAAAANRSEQRKVERFITVVDLMMCDSVYTDIIDRWKSEREKQRPVIEVKLLLNEMSHELVFEPILEDVQEEFEKVLASFLETASSVQRLLSNNQLMELLPDIDLESKDMTDVLHLPDHEQCIEDLMQYIQVAYTAAESYKNSFINFKDQFLKNNDIDFVQLGDDYMNHASHSGASVSEGQNPDVNLETIKKIISSMKHQIKSISTMLENIEQGPLRISLTDLKALLLESPNNCLERLNELRKCTKGLLEGLSCDLHLSKSGLIVADQSPAEFVNKLKHLEVVETRSEEFAIRVAELTDLYQMMEQYKLKITELDWATYRNLSSEYKSLQTAIQHTKQTKTEKTEAYKIELEKQFQEVVEKSVEIGLKARDDDLLSQDSYYESAVPTLKDLGEKMNDLRALSVEIQSYQDFLDLPTTISEEIEESALDISLRLELWVGGKKFTNQLEDWTNQSFNAIQLEQMEFILNSEEKSVNEMERVLPENQHLTILRQQANKFKKLYPVLTALQNKNLRDRHWEKIHKALGEVITPSSTLTSLLDMEILRWDDYISAISNEASQEASLEQSLNKITSKWTETDLDLVSYKEFKDVFILTSIEDVTTLLEDSLLTIGTISSSRFVSGIQSEVDRVNDQLSLFSETLEEWLVCQKNWIYLESIFSAPDIQRQLPAESKTFFEVDRSFKEIMKKTKDRPNALQAGTTPGWLEIFKQSNQTLEKIQKNLEDYLETKRIAFPRFYFLSNDELLEILAETKNVQAVQPHLGRCFDGIKKLEFGPEAKSINILSMISGDGEMISLGNNLKARGTVEKWLSDVETRMVQSLKRLAKSSYLSYPTEDRTHWILHQAAQLVLTVSQVHWCEEMEQAIDATNTNAVAEFYEINVQRLADLTTLVRSELSDLHRKITCALITIDVHSRDIVSYLQQQGVNEKSQFPWQMQLRHYWINDDIQICQANATKWYGYEYLGAQSRLVVTPMTDRCYLTLMGALQLKLGGAPAGPAGTGKTETVKDLAKGLGVNCVVFNCGENLDCKFMGKFFSGITQSGSWACLDEFNRIDLEVLSVVAQQMLTIQNAMKSDLHEFNFEGRNIKLNSNCGVFITMNPGYAGRTELPENLKALFRPMAMMIPDYTLVAEVMLFSEGFETSKLLSKKMVQLYKLSSEQLSQQDHYDFGMRALKSVLVMAGSLKRTFPNLQEEVVLIRAMRDTNIPKFLQDDIDLFENIISDLFPSIQIPDQVNDELERSIRAVLKAQELEQCDEVVMKSLQLHETLNVRFGVMLIGPPGSGKTKCYQILQQALTTLHKSDTPQTTPYKLTHSYVLNPKTVSIGELYGEYSGLTGEWSDGLASTLIRAASQDTTKSTKWIIFDGPVDAIWIESMNTVLDDNCTLCLPNGERIRLNSQTMKMLFEVEDLSVASPATVSRCGMVYVPSENLKWTSIMQKWLKSSKMQCIESSSRDKLLSLFTTFVPKGIEFSKQKGRHYFPPCDSSLVWSLCLLMESIIFKMLDVDQKGELEQRRLHLVFVFCFVWTFGGSLVESVQPEFDAFAKELFSPLELLSKEGSVFDFYIDPEKNEFQSWNKLVPSFQYMDQLPFSRILVPTTDTVKFSTLLKFFLAVDRSVLSTGQSGVGKTMIMRDALEDTGKIGDLLQLGAPLHKKLVFFVDDVNMPSKEIYGAQPAIELLRQVQDFKGLYDREKLFWKEIEDSILCAACAPPGGGRQSLSARFTRHFTVLSIPTPSRDSTHAILTALLSGHVNSSHSQMGEIMDTIATSCIDVYQRIVRELLPTPDRSHYLFNMRDLSRVVQGMMLMRKQDYQNSDLVVKLWIHEVLRVFHDRLVDQVDRQQMLEIVHDVLTKNLPVEGSRVTVQLEDILFGAYHQLNEEPNERLYMELDSKTSATNAMNKHLGAMKSADSMNLVFFDNAMKNISYLSRILKLPQGHAMLIGVGGSGKQSTARFAAHISGYQTFSVELTRNYNVPEFREDLKKLFKLTGVQNKRVAFIFSDSQITNELFLEDINSFLNSGQVPGLFTEEETEQITNELQQQNEITDLSKKDCLQKFLYRVQENLHLILIMSPVGDAFRRRCRQLPSLLNYCTLMWFSEWPEEALLSVSHKLLEEIDQSYCSINDKTKLAELCVKVHQSVSKTADRFYQELQRRYYVTPKSFIDLIQLYRTLLSEKRNEYTNSSDRLLNGLKKLQQCNAVIAEMKQELKKLEPVLKERTESTEKLMVKIAEDRKEAESVKLIVHSEEQEVKAMQETTQQIADEAKADLEEAMPALEAAVNSLKALNKNDIVEIKSFPKPPPLVQMTMEAVCILKQEKPDWDTSKRILGESNFMKSLEEFDKDSIPDGVIRKLKKYIDDPNFLPETVGKQSMAAMSLCMWVRAMEVYNRVGKLVEPKKLKLKETQEALEIANKALQEKQDALRSVEDRVLKLEQELQQAEDEQKQLKNQAELTSLRLERAAKLTSALEDEGLRWEQTAERIQQDTTLLTGDVFLSSACISYFGAFTGQYREDLLKQWTGFCKDMGIRISVDFCLQKILSSAIEIREWNLCGLPTDEVSSQNGILVNRARRWPLLIDPQCQANSWIKSLYSKDGLRVIKPTESNSVKILEGSIRVGNPVLLEDIGENFDPVLEPILQKNIMNISGRSVIKIGDTEVDYDPKFRLYLTTKLPNPHYLPEICNKVTIINFTVTMKGLEDQLLAEVVRRERKDLEEQKDQLVVSLSEDKQELRSLQDRILELLKESEGNILDDEQLINSRVAEAEETEKSINCTRELYRPAALRGALLYSVISGMAAISAMYQYSLAYFMKLFIHCIEASEQSDQVESRLSYLNNYSTSYLFGNIQKGLFGEHKLILSFLLCCIIYRNAPFDEISEQEWFFFTHGVLDLKDVAKPSSLHWISTEAWNGITYLHRNHKAFNGLTQSFRKDPQIWQKCVMSAKGEELSEDLPGEWNFKLTGFQKLILIKLMKQDQLVSSISAFVTEKLGPEYIEPAPWNLDEVFPSTNYQTPVIFILSPGADPTSSLLKFAKKIGWTPGEKLHVISMGQGQGPIAEMIIRQATTTGHWVYLQNCHVATSWLPKLTQLIEELLINSKATHPEFRLWITAMPSDKFPVAILQNGIKLTTEPPRGVKANLLKTYTDLNEFESYKNNPDTWRRLFFALAFFHAVVLQRRKFGPLGWNICYDFSPSDLECSLSTVQIYLEGALSIPWSALQYLIGEIHYGGRVTDEWDRRCLQSLISKFINSKILEEEVLFVGDEQICPPVGESMKEQRQSLQNLPTAESPELFGMHSNAETLLQLQDGKNFVKCVLRTQPRQCALSSAENLDRTVLDKVDELLKSLKPLLSKANAKHSLFDKNENGQLNSLSVVLDQEIQRFNQLTSLMKRTLEDLNRAIKGSIVMTLNLEAMYHSILANRVPDLWTKSSYPSIKALASWMADYHQRINFIYQWIENGPPSSFWISGFFFPQGFITGVLQMHARKHLIPIDTLSFDFSITPWMDPKQVVDQTPEDGVYVHGMFIEAGQWDHQTGRLVDAEKGYIHSKLPLVHFQPIEHPCIEGKYTCPLYKTSKRSGSLSTTGSSTNYILSVHLPIPDDRTSDFYIQRGTALLTMLDD
eukprot:g3598.t1